MFARNGCHTLRQHYIITVVNLWIIASEWYSNCMSYCPMEVIAFFASDMQLWIWFVKKGFLMVIEVYTAKGQIV